ncbi:uncharacterized protein B0P05DRAFT_551815 [Gilbertella persicaria]|uniref:uncharacterized protein n=1 Tax=Gilbertella persicaria TaxID=101096 RepID=UPI00221F6C99|nr:uncharacterized protein B0P05DRAFT_551815 [Gilbertella persicaria]KAI8068113.1 hypothetical protein B0P05DRAFT_551815 [Gilbertella persicaria]
MTQQQNASLQALQQTMQLNELNTSNNTNQSGESDDSSTSQPQQRQKKLPRQPKTAENKEEKPPVGSEEWHKQRRENHKQVERRRRETINDGINEIARIVPGCEKNKGSILQRAAVYIRQLKENETATMEKWTLEKLLTDQAMSELNRQVELLKVELDRARMENNYLKRELENATGPDSKKHKKE